MSRAGAAVLAVLATVPATVLLAGCGAPEPVALPAWAQPVTSFRAAASTDAQTRYDLVLTGVVRSYAGKDAPAVREVAVLPPRTRDELVAALDSELSGRGLTRTDLGGTDDVLDHSSVLWRDGEDDEPVVLVWVPDALPSDKGRPAVAILLEPRR